MKTALVAEAGNAGWTDSVAGAAPAVTANPSRLVEHCVLEAREILRDAPDYEGVQNWAVLLEEFAAGGEAYLESLRREDGYLLRHTLVCAQGCDSVAAICRELEHPEAPQLERFCRVCEKFLEREFREQLEIGQVSKVLTDGILMGKAS